MRHEEKARLVAWPHSDCIEPRAADALVENIAAALREERERTIEECARLARDYDYKTQTRSGIWAATRIRELKAKP